MEQLGASLPWVNEVPGWLVRFIGISQLAGALGLILPQLTGIQPKLTPLAAWGLALTMGLAAIFHITKGEYQALPINVVLGGLAAFVAYRRGQELK